MLRPLAAASFLLLTASCATSSSSSSSSPPSAASSSSPSAPSSSSSSSSAAPSSEALLAEARAGCARGIRDPNEKQFLTRMLEKGAPPDEAVAEADLLFDGLDPLFGQMCDCVFTTLGGWEKIYSEGQKAGSLETWMKQQMASPTHGPALAACSNTLMESMQRSMQERLPEIKAFRERWRAEHPTTTTP